MLRVRTVKGSAKDEYTFRFHASDVNAGVLP
jgi:hypothetical protein